MSLTEHTPIEQLYNFYKKHPEQRGGSYTREFLFAIFTVEEHDKFWVFEKLMDLGLIEECGIIINDEKSYMVSRGADRILRWMIEKS